MSDDEEAAVLFPREASVERSEGEPESSDVDLPPMVENDDSSKAADISREDDDGEALGNEDVDAENEDIIEKVDGVDNESEGGFVQEPDENIESEALIENPASPTADDADEEDGPKSPVNNEEDDEVIGKPSTSALQAVEDIFGNSESEDEEFEGFDKSKVSNQEDEVGAAPRDNDEGEGTRRTTIIEPADDDEEAGAGDGEKTIQEEQDDSSDDERDRYQRPDIVYDFDVMMQRKKEENHRKRKRRNIDIINDSDDVIADLIGQMKNAADEDFEFNKDRKPATSKIKFLPKIESALRKIDLREAFLDAGILSVITDWLTPLPDRSLPNIKVRETMLSILDNFNVNDSERLKASGIGKAVMYLSKHPKESKENKARAKLLISKWSRFIFNLEADFHSISKEEREDRDREHMSNSKRKRGDSVSEESTPKGKDEVKRPGTKGWIPRARVPQPSNRDYVHRPKSSVEAELIIRGSSKKPVSRLEQMQRNYAEKRKASKATRAVKISIEGRKM